MTMLIYVMAPSVQEYHDYLRREGINEDAARFVVSQAVYDAMMDESKTEPWLSRLVVIGFPDWYRQAA